MTSEALNQKDMIWRELAMTADTLLARYKQYVGSFEEHRSWCPPEVKVLLHRYAELQRKLQPNP